MAKSKYAHLKDEPRGNPSDAGRRNAALEKSREALMDSILQYKEMLNETVLLSNKTQPEKQKMAAVLEQINNLVLELDSRNLGEGSRTLGTTAINAILFLKDEVNQLKFHNYYLTKRVEELESAQESEEQVDESTEK